MDWSFWIVLIASAGCCLAILIAYGELRHRQDVERELAQSRRDCTKWSQMFEKEADRNCDLERTNRRLATGIETVQAENRRLRREVESAPGRISMEALSEE